MPRFKPCLPHWLAVWCCVTFSFSVSLDFLICKIIFFSFNYWGTKWILKPKVHKLCQLCLTTQLMLVVFNSYYYLLLLLLLSHFSSPPGSSVPGILQARTLEWVAISFSSAWKWKWSRSVVSDSLWLHGLQPTRLLCPWIFHATVLEWVAIFFSILLFEKQRKGTGAEGGRG